MSDKILSGSEFLEALCDQALLSRARKGQLIGWEWNDDAEKATAMLRDGFWLGALVAAYLDAIFDASRPEEVALSVVGIQYPVMQNLTHRASDKCPMYQSWFVGWAVDHTTRALCASPRFADPFVLDRRGGKRHFSREGGVVRVNNVTP